MFISVINGDIEIFSAMTGTARDLETSVESDTEGAALDSNAELPVATAHACGEQTTSCLPRFRTDGVDCCHLLYNLFQG
jgi:hypothetical protein